METQILGEVLGEIDTTLILKVIKIGIIFTYVVVLFFALLMWRQVTLLDRFLKTRLGLLWRFLASLYVLGVLLLIFWLLIVM